MDLQKVSDIIELKALAFDTLQAIELQQNNLRAIQQRIAELEQAQSKKSK